MLTIEFDHDCFCPVFYRAYIRRNRWPLGVPYEFRSSEKIPDNAPQGYEPPTGYDRAHPSVPAGTWSDDGAQALCLTVSLVECGSFDPVDFGQRLVNWYDDGYLAVDGIVFDVGVTTGRALLAIKSGTSPLEAGPNDVHDNGNGSLMRSLPLAIWHRGSNEQLITDAHDQSSVTHGHTRSKVCCALYCLWARQIILGSLKPWEDAVSLLRKIYDNDSSEFEELEWAIRPDLPPEGNGSGYVVDSLRSARLASLQPTFAGVIKSAVGLGNDTDTTACIAGGIAGLMYGIQGIPPLWRSELRGHEILDPILVKFVKQVTSNRLFK